MSDTEKLEVLIKAVDQATATLAKVESQVSGLGKTTQKTNAVTSQVSKMMTGQFGDVAKAVMSTVAPIATVGAAVFTTAKFVSSSVSDWVAYNEEVRKLGIATGASTDDLSRLMQAADDLGVSMDAMHTAMRLASQNGITPTIDNLAKLSDRLIAIDDESARAKEMQKIFGRGWEEVAGFILQGSEAIREGTAAIADNMVVTGKSVKQSRDYSVAVDNLSDSWTGLKNTVASVVIPPATDWISSFNELVTTITMLDGAFDDNTITMGEHNRLLLSYYGGTKEASEITAILAGKVNDMRAAFKAANPEIAPGKYDNLATSITDVDVVTTQMAESQRQAAVYLRETAMAAIGATEGLEEYEGSVSKADYATKSLAGAIGSVPKEVNIGFDFKMPDVTSEVGNLVKGMKWEAAGGTAIEDFYAGIKGKLAGLSLPNATAIGAQLGALELSAKVKIGDISPAEAKQQLMDAFGLSYGEASVTLKAALEADPTSAEGIQEFLTETLATPTKAKIEPEVDQTVLDALFGTGETGLAQSAAPKINPELNLPIYEAVYGTMSTAVNVPTFSVLNMPSYLSIKSQITTPLTIPVNIKLSGLDVGALETLIHFDLNDNGAIGRAMGGPVTAGQPYWVGERGIPELFVPQQAGEIVPMDKVGGSTNNYYSMTINTSAKTEPLIADYQMMKAWGG